MHFGLCCLKRIDFWTAETLVVGEGFEPSKAMPSDLQSDSFDRSENPPLLYYYCVVINKKQEPAKGLEPLTC